MPRAHFWTSLVADSPDLVVFLDHQRNGADRRNLITLGGLVLVEAGLIALTASIWILAVIGVICAVFLWEILSRRGTSLLLNSDEIRWKSGSREASITLKNIQKVRLVRRLDFSFSLTVVGTDGHKHRLPQDVLPTAAKLQKALADAGIATDPGWFF